MNIWLLTTKLFWKLYVQLHINEWMIHGIFSITIENVQMNLLANMLLKKTIDENMVKYTQKVL
jgi:hypothetical protein